MTPVASTTGNWTAASIATSGPKVGLRAGSSCGRISGSTWTRTTESASPEPRLSSQFADPRLKRLDSRPDFIRHEVSPDALHRAGELGIGRRFGFDPIDGEQAVSTEQALDRTGGDMA